MDKKHEYRLAIGSGVGLALLGWALPIMIPTVPPYVGYLVCAVGVFFVLWGVWPPTKDWINSLRSPALAAAQESAPTTSGGDFLIPLREASRLVFEATENWPAGHSAKKHIKPDEIIRSYAMWILGNMAELLPLHGRHPASSQVLPIYSYNREWLTADANSIQPPSGSTTHTDLQILRSHVDIAIERFRRAPPEMFGP
jgi:hypothetical protein